MLTPIPIMINRLVSNQFFEMKKIQNKRLINITVIDITFTFRGIAFFSLKFLIYVPNIG